MSVALRQYGCLLDEGLTRALWLVAAKPADQQIDDCLPTCDWEIAQIALVTTVERFRPGTAIWAMCARGFAANGDVDDFITQLYLLDNEPSAGRQQQLWIHSPPCGWPSDPPGRSVLPGQSGATQPAPKNLDIPAPTRSRRAF